MRVKVCLLEIAWQCFSKVGGAPALLGQVPIAVWLQLLFASEARSRTYERSARLHPQGALT